MVKLLSNTATRAGLEQLSLFGTAGPPEPLVSSLAPIPSAAAPDHAVQRSDYPGVPEDLGSGASGVPDVGSTLAQAVEAYQRLQDSLMANGSDHPDTRRWRQGLGQAMVAADLEPQAVIQAAASAGEAPADGDRV